MRISDWSSDVCSSDLVCRIGARVTVNGVAMGEALDRDRLGRELPVWQGCRLIADGEIFLMNWSVEDSLDGRYFGPISTRSIIGRATPVWTDEDGSGRFDWRAATRGKTRLPHPTHTRQPP